MACSYLDLQDKKIGSLYRPNLTEDIMGIAKEWQRSVEVMAYWSDKGAINIRYEDLVADPCSVLTKVCEFLSLSYSDQMLDYYKHNDEPEEFKAWKGKTFEPVAMSSVGRYEADLTKEQIQIFESAAGDALRLGGYEL